MKIFSLLPSIKINSKSLAFVCTIMISNICTCVCVCMVTCYFTKLCYTWLFSLNNIFYCQIPLTPDIENSRDKAYRVYYQSKVLRNESRLNPNIHGTETLRSLHITVIIRAGRRYYILVTELILLSHNFFAHLFLHHEIKLLHRIYYIFYITTDLHKTLEKTA